MRIIIQILAIILLISSCVASKKITKIETQSDVKVQTSLLDTSKRSSAWEIVLNSVIKEIDLTKILITTYYTEKDSTGKQLVKEEIVINQDKTTTVTSTATDVKTEQESRAISADTTLSEVTETKTEVTEKRGTSPVKLYLIVFVVIFAVAVGILLKFRKLKF
jgi:hypothetical protein